ncbi:EF-hand calcium-binding domain-containing protein 6 [Stegastes partitus]|uniref:EF-hand calcium-binding domain-containing protein 6 n=1 Tax=Stegastes partitus TaxID=144197 RepID=A0A9Y4KCP1_9TELE|nr:PREDICTED: EF-hand calcium-binding domain-containing protein 6 [Stegastes partitus]
MAQQQPLHLALGELVMGSRPGIAPSTTVSSTGWGQTGGKPRRTWILKDRARPATSHPGLQLTVEQVEPLICSRLVNIQAALRAADPNGTGLVSKEEFRRVLKNLLSVSQNQLNSVISEIGGNLRTVIRLFRLFDYNRGGHIQQQEFRRILDNYCTRLTDKEFHRLWNHYSPNNVTIINYEVFLDKLGFGDSFKIAPVCTKLVWRALQAFDTTRSGLVKQDVLRAVLSSFIFPMNPLSFQKLTGRYGVRATGPVRWKHFLGHFMSPLSGKEDANRHDDRASERAAPDVDKLNLHTIYPHLKEILRVQTTEAGCISRADLRYFVERPGGTSQPRLPQSQIRELLNVLDPEHSGVIQLTRLKSLLSSIASDHLDNVDPTATPAETPFIHEDTEDAAEEQNTADEKQTTQWADGVSVASASWRTVEGLLLDRLCEQLSSVLAALKLYDPQHTGHVTQEDLKEVLSCYGMPISDAHFKKRQWSSSSQRTGLDSCNILDVVFQRMKLRLEQRHTSLRSRIQAVIHRADEAELSEADVRKILEDTWVILDDKHFSRFTETLGFRDGRIERSVFQAKYEEATAGDHLQGSKLNPVLTSAEQCLAAMKTRIMSVHRDNLTAFRLMDRRRKGVVDCHGFKALYDSLGFFCSQDEYQRLLGLIGLHPGNNLNYAEFVSVVENGGKRQTQAASVQQQLHELLACEARSKWADMSKVLCQFDQDGQGRIYKKSLRGLLFTYALPMKSNEFEEFWSRYDQEGRGSVEVCDFLDRLCLHHDEELRSESLKLNQTVVQQDADKPVSSEATSLEHIEQVVHENYRKLSDELTRLGTQRDGTVTVEELLSLLHACSCCIQREQLVDHLHRLRVSMDDSCRRLSYLDFLSAFDRKAEECERPPASPDAVHHMESLDSLSPNMALAFSAFDRSGTGAVRALDFRQVLENFCARLSDKQYRYMLTKLELDADTCTVHWKDFLNKFQLQSPQSALQCSSRRPASVGRPETGSPLGSMERRLRGAVQRCWKEIQRKCSELDPQREGCISAASFLGILQALSIRMTEEQFEHLAVKLDIMNNGHVSYHNFLRHFLLNLKPAETQRAFERRRLPLPVESLLERAQRGGRQRGTDSRPPTQTQPPGVTQLLQQMHSLVSGHLYEITRELTDLDPCSSATVSKEHFRQICDRHHLRLTNDQFECVWSQMPLNEQRKLQYREFLKRFGALGAERSPEPTRETQHGCSDAGGSTVHRTKMSLGLLSTDCVKVMLRIYETVRSSWTSIRRCFLTSDRNRTGSVAVQDFRKVLHHFSVSLSEEEFFHLSSYFDDNTTGKICYNSFLWTFLH